jgi:hypothetical protein
MITEALYSSVERYEGFEGTGYTHLLFLIMRMGAAGASKTLTPFFKSTMASGLQSLITV